MKEVKKRATLIDENGYPIAIYHYKTNEETYVEGKIHSIHSWDSNKNPTDKSFFADAYVKWDACSHFNFYGEDYKEDAQEEKDSYYHICGVYNYIEHIQTMQFALEVLVREYPRDFQYPKELDKLRNFNLLKDCKIIYG